MAQQGNVKVEFEAMYTKFKDLNKIEKKLYIFMFEKIYKKCSNRKT